MHVWPSTDRPPARPAQRKIGEVTKERPHAISGGFDLRDATTSPDGRVVIASHSGYQPHGLVVIDTRTQKEIQHIDLKTVWLGMTWTPDGHTLFIPGGNATGIKKIENSAAPIYEFQYKNGRLELT
ncbi:YncE family protein [Edaphobacter sp. 12200R-103]|uniref:YncE family protein n=1 Tax=Edaphobacter sp. 12200R-103 TaxID=2703788 RepID=UPI00138CEF30|nr:hypothetical protein [Edaphobacter sp. 12200R-103]QHS50624.1 hypothetical protein GWR55_01840 [Edaphobacter sp. 12200R-103]